MNLNRYLVPSWHFAWGPSPPARAKALSMPRDRPMAAMGRIADGMRLRRNSGRCKAVDFAMELKAHTGILTTTGCPIRTTAMSTGIPMFPSTSGKRIARVFAGGMSAP